MVDRTDSQAQVRRGPLHEVAIPSVFPLDTRLQLVSVGLLFVDAFVTIVAALVAHYVRFGNVNVPGKLVAIVIAAAVLMPGLNRLLGGYEFGNIRQLLSSTRKAWMSWAIVVSTLLGLAFLGKVSSEFSRLWAANWLIIAGGGYLLARVGAATVGARLVSRYRLATQIGVVDFGGRYGAIRRELEAQYGTNVTVGPPYAADAQKLLNDIRAGKIDIVLVPIAASFRSGASGLLQRLRSTAVKVLLLPEVPTVGFRLRSAAILGNQTALEIMAPPLDSRRYFVKSVVDWVLAAFAVIVLLPVLAAIALAIKLGSPGPVLFRQMRNGLNNREIEVLKFRTMGEAASNALAFQQATKGDSRVTRVGRFLRRTSLDELPQLFNILRGDLALIGPRPHAVEHNEQFDNAVRDFASRHRVKPGITGWAQVNGWRGPTDTPEKMQRRVEHDLYYIENWSLGLDLKILLLTVGALVKGNNAH